MLPSAESIDFPPALKAARIARGMSRTALARAAHIHPVMPRRYEEPECGEFTRPTMNTWTALNRALGYSESGVVRPAPRLEEQPVIAAPAVLSLRDATIEQIVAELHSRGIEPDLFFRKRGTDADAR